MSPGGDIIGVLRSEILEKVNPFPISLCFIFAVAYKISTYVNVRKRYNNEKVWRLTAES
jgi:hypothetical protein